MNYFGTSLTEKGHYFWILDGDTIRKSRLSFGDIPFNPESLPNWDKTEYLPKGTVRYYFAFGFGIIAIEGSCNDKRPGAKSIFFVELPIHYEPMKKMLLEIPIAKKIIEQMPFELSW